MDTRFIAGIAITLAFLIGVALSPVKKIPVEATSVPMDRVYPNPTSPPLVNPCADFEGTPEEKELEDVQVPVPMKDRVFNKTRIQCVWCSLELLGRWAEEPKLIDLTDDPECKSYSGPSSAARKLNMRKVRFEQETNKKTARMLILKAVVKERHGVLFSIPGHAMNLVHYDEAKGVVKYINNSDKTLKIRTWSMEEFEKRWEGWVCAIYADQDIIESKLFPPATFLPIIDRMGDQGRYDPKIYIPIPGRKFIDRM